MPPTGQPIRIEISSRSEISNQNHERHLEINAKSFKSEDSQGIIIVIHDVTKLRKLEQVRRDFIANVSHELKTPLTNIRGYAETLLEEDALPLFASRFLQKIYDNSIRLGHLVQDILQLSNLEADNTAKDLTPQAWLPIIDQAISDQEGSMQKKKLTISKNLHKSTQQVWGDHDMMLVILSNLLSNAIRYTPEGGHITISTQMNKDNHTILDIEDNGIGIDEDQLPRIFERFYRVDKARSRQLGGTGLGLSIVKHLVSNLEGQITLRSKIGTGTAFSVWLRSAPNSH